MDTDQQTSNRSSQANAAQQTSRAGSSKLADAGDPAALLRAAALMSRKRVRTKKGNKGATRTSTLPIPAPSRLDVIVSDSFQLDYGSEDVTPADPPLDSTSSNKPETALSDEEEGQIREEGEISDSESPQPALSGIAPPPVTTLVNKKVSPIPQTLVVDTLSTKPPRHASPTNIMCTSNDPLVASPTSIGPRTRSSSLDHTLPILDENHIRPGLASQYQFDRNSLDN
jgi:hypothetical protein